MSNNLLCAIHSCLLVGDKDVKKIDQYRGAMVGLAVGDALGTTLEFSSPGSFDPIYDMVGGGPFRLEPGQWTDDTAMSLCLAASLVEKRSFDPVDQLERYTRWYKKGYMSCTRTCFDIGYTTRTALERFQETGEPYCGPTGLDSSGNGSIMRLAPVPLFFAGDDTDAARMSGMSSQTTHGSPLAVDACRYLGSLISGIVSGRSKEEVLSHDDYEPAPDYWKATPLTERIERIRQGSFKRLEPPQIKGSGFVVESLEAALWAFYKSTSFREGCLMAVNLGDDADTTGAVYGQLAGAYYGINGIPGAWTAKIARLGLIESLAEEIFRLCNLDA